MLLRAALAVIAVGCIAMTICSKTLHIFVMSHLLTDFIQLGLRTLIISIVCGTIYFSFGGNSQSTVYALLAAILVWQALSPLLEKILRALIYQRRHRMSAFTIPNDQLAFGTAEFRKTCIHEAGHLAMFGLLEKLPEDAFAAVDLNPEYGFAGFATGFQQSTIGMMTCEQLRWEVMCLLGGAAAEQVIYETHSTGCSSDFDRAEERLRLLASIEQKEVYFRNPANDTEHVRNVEAMRVIRAELMALAIEFLTANRQYVIEIADFLEEKHSMDCEEFLPIWQTIGSHPLSRLVELPVFVACLPVEKIPRI